VLPIVSELREKGRRQQRGFSLLETMVSIVVLSAVAAIVMSGMIQLTGTQGTIANRTEMHTSVRNATELLQQEIGQAGKISLPNPATPVTLGAATAIGATTATVSSSLNMFVGEQLVIDTGTHQETVLLSAVLPTAPTITFVTTPLLYAHANNAPVSVEGGFATGIVPPDGASAACTSAGYVPVANGSTCNVLKLYGDINDDGSMLYVIYSCDTTTVPGFLYRNEVPFDSATIDATTKLALLNNVLVNPPDVNNNPVSCFSYQTRQSGLNSYVIDVAVTLTEQTQQQDPVTHQFQTETKALLNVSPRNVYNVWRLDSINQLNRVQPMPPSVFNLLSTVP
jgi:prepilin-type N-terminal cleavage/methylation domain-containing protein